MPGQQRWAACPQPGGTAAQRLSGPQKRPRWLHTDCMAESERQERGRREACCRGGGARTAAAASRPLLVRSLTAELKLAAHGIELPTACKDGCKRGGQREARGVGDRLAAGRRRRRSPAGTTPRRQPLSTRLSGCVPCWWCPGRVRGRAGQRSRRGGRRGASSIVPPSLLVWTVACVPGRVDSTSVWERERARDTAALRGAAAARRAQLRPNAAASACVLPSPTLALWMHATLLVVWPLLGPASRKHTHGASK